MSESIPQATEGPAKEVEIKDPEIGQIKNEIDEFLQNGSLNANDFDILTDLAGQLSTDPSKVSPHVNFSSTASLCGPISWEIAKELRPKRKYWLTRSSGKNFSNHRYLTTTTKIGNEVIVDATIGQFLEEHRHCFVGTREELRNIFLTQVGSGKKYHLDHTRSKDNPEEAFDRIYGENGHRISTPKRRNSKVRTSDPTSPK